MNKKLKKWIFWVIILTGALFLASVFSLCIGAAGIPVKKILYIIMHGRGSTEYSIIFDIRLPRIILGFAVGGALSLAGVILQGMFRNPLVEPYTLGISGGAALGVCLNLILGLNRVLGVMSLAIAGFLGSVAVIFIVYSLSMKRNSLNMQKVLLTGVMVSFVSSSLIMFLMAVSKVEDLQGIVFWVMGSLDQTNWLVIKMTLFISLAGLLLSYIFCFDLNAFMIGEEDAAHLGVNTERTKKLLFVLASVLTGVSISSAGIIGFIGLVVPHFVRLFIGSDHRILLFCSYITGAIFLILCDTAARTVISPIELPVGVVTGMVGGLLFIYALSKKQ